MASVQTAPNLPQAMTQAAITETYSVKPPTFLSLNSLFYLPSSNLRPFSEFKLIYQ